MVLSLEIDDIFILVNNLFVNTEKNFKQEKTLS